MSQTMVNHGLFEGQDQMPTVQTCFFPFPGNLSFPSLGCHQPLKTFSAIAPALVASEAASNTANLTETLLASVAQKPREDLNSTLGGTQLLSLQRSSLNPWAWGDVSDCLSNRRSTGGDHEHHLGVSAMKMKRIKGRRKVREPRFCFKTMSDVDVLDDGYKWRKYGQKVVKNTQHPRSYYRCTQDNCRVKKRVERLAEDPRMVITTYEGRHAHSPSNDLEDSQTPSQISNFLW